MKGLNHWRFVCKKCGWLGIIDKSYPTDKGCIFGIILNCKNRLKILRSDDIKELEV